MTNFGICKLIRKWHCFHDVFAYHNQDKTDDTFQVCCHCGTQRKQKRKRSKLHGEKHIHVAL